MKKSLSILVVIFCVLFFAAGSAQAGGVIEEWIARYNGPANGLDCAYAMAVDDSGNIYVTGKSYGSGTNYDYATIKYDPNGNELWVRRYNGPGNGYDEVKAITLDDYGNIYVIGESIGSGTGYDYATIKYNSAGVEMWVRRYYVPGKSYDGARAIVIDSSGSIYVTGTSGIFDSDTGYDYATIKYDTNGNLIWVRRYNGHSDGFDYGEAIALDGSGNIYVTGYSYVSGTGDDYATIKYDSDGNELWVRRYNGPGNYCDAAEAIALDSSGNVYVTGKSHISSSSTSGDYATIKYDSNGNQLWDARYNGPANDVDWAYSITVDGSDNIYVAGKSIGSGTDYDYATIKYDSDGNELWVRRFNGPGNGYDKASAVAVDVSGNIYVTGTSTGSDTSYDYATIKYAQCLNPIAGDLNDDCKVNFIDFAIFAMAWLGDDLIDLAIISENWLECNWSSPELCL